MHMCLKIGKTDNCVSIIGIQRVWKEFELDCISGIFVEEKKCSYGRFNAKVSYFVMQHNNM